MDLDNPNITFLQNEHRNKITSSVILLYLWIGALSMLLQQNFLLQNMQRMKDDISIKYLSSDSRDPMEEEAKEVQEPEGLEGRKKNKALDRIKPCVTQMGEHAWGLCGSAPDGALVLKAEVTHDPIDNDLQMETNFSKRVLL